MGGRGREGLGPPVFVHHAGLPHKRLLHQPERRHLVSVGRAHNHAAVVDVIRKAVATAQMSEGSARPVLPNEGGLVISRIGASGELCNKCAPARLERLFWETRRVSLGITASRRALSIYGIAFLSARSLGSELAQPAIDGNL